MGYIATNSMQTVEEVCRRYWEEKHIPTQPVDPTIKEHSCFVVMTSPAHSEYHGRYHEKY